MARLRRQLQLVLQDPYPIPDLLISVVQIISEGWVIQRDIFPKPQWKVCAVELRYRPDIAFIFIAHDQPVMMQFVTPVMVGDFA